MAIRHVIYLHGFASSPVSFKARRFAREVGERGIAFSCPDFNQPEFETMTVTRMLAQTQDAIAAGPAGGVALVGSSLGAFVAVHAAVQEPGTRIERLVLLAPALDFGSNRLRQLGEDGVEEWRRSGRLGVFHYGFNEKREIGFSIYEDAARHDSFAVPWMHPTLVFQGTKDTSVDPGMVEEWCQARPAVSLRLLEDDHQLAASVDLIWRESAAFLRLDAPIRR